jgi:mRNA-degrading endonuclease YafQ of YafQ-DinJ toxin-antitoxin module
MEVSFSSSFRRAFKKQVKGKTDLEARFWAKVEMFTSDSFEPSLRTYKLSGRLKGLWSFSLEYNERVPSYFTIDGNAIFIDIGTHNEVY